MYDEKAIWEKQWVYAVESVRGLRKATHNDGSPDLGRLQSGQVW